MLPARGKYLRYDMIRSTARAGKPEIRSPKDLMAQALTVLVRFPAICIPYAMLTTMQPNRALHYIKRNYPQETYEAAIHHLFHSFWTPPNLNITQPAVLAKVLATAPSFSGAGSRADSKKPLFTREQIEEILGAAKSQEVKDLLTSATQEALDRGAFGAPWLWVTNGAGKEEPFFGSDR